MATKKISKKSKKTKSTVKHATKPIAATILDQNADLYAPERYTQSETVKRDLPIRSRKFNTWYGVIALLILLVGIFFVRKGYIVSALVDGKPIFSWNLQQLLTRRFGKQMLEGMITEQLIANEAAKAGVKINKSDIDAREQDMIKNIGENVTIDDLLKYQGLSREEFDSQIRMQLWVEKILGKDISITENDIENFIATNRARLVATTEAELNDEARKMLFDQLIGKLIQPWFTEIKSKANIIVFP